MCVRIVSGYSGECCSFLESIAFCCSFLESTAFCSFSVAATIMLRVCEIMLKCSTSVKREGMFLQVSPGVSACLSKWEYYGSASVLKVYSFPGQEQATWESIGILVSTLSWSYFLGLELHPYAGAQSSLGLVCSKLWALSRSCAGEAVSSCPSALSAVPGGLRQ